MVHKSKYLITKPFFVNKSINYGNKIIIKIIQSSKYNFEDTELFI